LAPRNKSLTVSRLKSLLSFTSPFSKITEQYKSTRTNLFFLMKQTGGKILTVTSPNKGEGKTTTLVNLAVSMAKGNEKVLIIDANFRNPCLHTIFKLPNQSGFLDVLKEDVLLENAVYTTHIKNLHVLISGELTPRSLEVINSQKIADFFTEVTEGYDRILIDAPSVLEAAEARFLASKSDGVIMIAHRYVTKQEDFAKASRALKVAKANIIGTVLNERSRYQLEHYFF
jgi:capsular exopolysaccharide synthesis family protein